MSIKINFIISFKTSICVQINLFYNLGDDEFFSAPAEGKLAFTAPSVTELFGKELSDFERRVRNSILERNGSGSAGWCSLVANRSVSAEPRHPPAEPNQRLTHGPMANLPTNSGGLAPAGAEQSMVE